LNVANSTFSGHSGSRPRTAQLGGKRAYRVASGRTGVRAKAATPLRARNTAASREVVDVVDACTYLPFRQR
jgi:hypothetical protein